MDLPKHHFPIQWQILQTNWRCSNGFAHCSSACRHNNGPRCRSSCHKNYVQNKPIVLWRYVGDTFVAFNDMSVLDIFFITLNSAHNNVTFTKELECGDSLAFLDVLIEKTQSGIQTTMYRKPTHSGLYIHWTSFIPHHQKRNPVFGLLDRAYKIASTYNAIHSEFMNIKSMLIRNGYPKAYIDRWTMKYLNKKHETSVNSFTITPSMTTTINMRLPYLRGISCEVRREMQRLNTAMPSCPFSYVSYMKLTSWKNLLHINTNRIIFVA